MIAIQTDTTLSEHGHRLLWFRWACSCGATGSWLHDPEKVSRMASAHGVRHVDEVQP